MSDTKTPIHTIQIHNFDLLYDRSRTLLWQWAEQDAFDQDDWSDRLRDLLKGLKVGRLRVAISEQRCKHLEVPIHDHPEALEPAFLVALIICANSPEAWREAANWSIYATTAQTIAAALHEKLPVAGTEDFRKEMAYRAGYALDGTKGRPMGYGADPLLFE